MIMDVLSYHSFSQANDFLLYSTNHFFQTHILVNSENLNSSIYNPQTSHLALLVFSPALNLSQMNFKEFTMNLIVVHF